MCVSEFFLHSRGVVSNFGQLDESRHLNCIVIGYRAVRMTNVRLIRDFWHGAKFLPKLHLHIVSIYVAM